MVQPKSSTTAKPSLFNDNARRKHKNAIPMTETQKSLAALIDGTNNNSKKRKRKAVQRQTPKLQPVTSSRSTAFAVPTALPACSIFSNRRSRNTSSSVKFGDSGGLQDASTYKRSSSMVKPLSKSSSQRSNIANSRSGGGGGESCFRMEAPVAKPVQQTTFPSKTAMMLVHNNNNNNNAPSNASIVSAKNNKIVTTTANSATAVSKLTTTTTTAVLHDDGDEAAKQQGAAAVTLHDHNDNNNNCEAATTTITSTAAASCLELSIMGRKRRRRNPPARVSFQGTEVAASASLPPPPTTNLGDSKPVSDDKDDNDDDKKPYTTVADIATNKQRSNVDSDLVLPAPAERGLQNDALKTASSSTTAEQTVQEKLSAVWQPLPRPQQIDANSMPTTKRKSAKQQGAGNYVRQNLRNSAGACLGARNKKAKSKGRLKWEQRKKDRDEWYEKRGIQEGYGGKARRGRQDSANQFVSKSGIDPLDDFIDGVFNPEKRTTGEKVKKKKKKDNGKQSSIPVCTGHQRPCKKLVVKKPGPNKGRTFYCCCSPRSEQCDFFEWADDTIHAAQMVLLKNSTQSGFVSRQVAAYMDRIKDLTVPELSKLAEKQGLAVKGKKQELLTRISIWVRDEINDSLPDEGISKQEQSSEIVHESKESGDDEGSSGSCVFGDESDDSSTLSDECIENNDERSDKANTPFLELESSDDESSCPSSAGVQEKTDEIQSTPVQKALALFGYSSFREGQEWCVSRCLEKKRTLFVAPTGFGKSLCYALPASMLQGVCIVVSPLIALIQDQLRVLPPSLPAATLSGSATKAQMAATIDDIIRGRIKIVFVSPERLASASFRRLFRPGWNTSSGAYERSFPPVSLLCVDEAHCASQWAHNFRPSYLRLKSMIGMIDPESILAMTATAGPRVVQNICETLNICDYTNEDDPGVKVMSCNRDNIDVQSLLLESQAERLDKLSSILAPEDKMKKKKDRYSGVLAKGSVIVYVWRQLDAEAVAENIQAAGALGGVVVYHGGMDAASRAKSQSKFMRGKARICVATVAFGLGINKPDIRGVIHMYLSASPEHYLQETGRAGRDGKASRAIALVLQEEVLVRHSLAHSDLVAASQIRSLFSLLSEEAKNAQHLLTIEASSNLHPLSIGLPLAECSSVCGVSSETVETIMSLLEQRQTPLLAIEGVFYDKAFVAPRLGRLEDLAKREPVVAAIIKCSLCVEAPAGEVALSSAPALPSSCERHVIDESFGSFSFSVAQCANVLGNTAEPRHVFAALRRLQNSGDIELVLDTSEKGRALNIRLTTAGVEMFGLNSGGNSSSLVSWAHELCRETVLLSASKVLDIHYILKVLAQHCQSGEESIQGTKSTTLQTFQDLVQKYFEAEGRKEALATSVSMLPRFLQVEPSRLFRDVRAALSTLQDTFSALSGNKSLLFAANSAEAGDYAALVVAKFLHGVVPSGLAPKLLRSHPLFGQYQGSLFSKLLSAVQEILEVEH